MNRRQIIGLIEGGENLVCEFKLKFSTHEKIAKEFIAFANTAGGTVLFGVDDDGKIAGVQSEKSIAELIGDTASNFCEPPVKYSIYYFNIENKEIVAAQIPESANKPHRLNDYKPFDITTAQVYLRVQDKSVQASREMIRILNYERTGTELKKYIIGELEKKLFELFEKKEQITVKEFCAEANISYRRASRAMVKLVRAGVLALFVKGNGEEYFTLRSEIQN